MGCRGNWWVSLSVGGEASDRVHIRFCGNGHLGFRPYGGSLLANAPKVTKRSVPHHSAPRLGSVCPHSGIAPWARREGPSMAQRGYPGIHAGMPTPQYLRSASVVNGAPRSTSTARRPDSRPGALRCTPIPLWERACSRRRPYSRPGALRCTPISLWERACSRRRPYSRPGSSGRTPVQSVGAELAREAA